MQDELSQRAAGALFSVSYREARARFREAAVAAGCALSAYPIGARGPSGEELAIDVARSAHASAKHALVISSGTHGVEGYFGSAVQLAVLKDAALLTRARERSSLVLIHALNPYGFAYMRRTNEHNVDQNRNFVLDGARFEGAPAGYRALDSLLNPKSAPTGLDAFYLRAALAVARSGFRTLKNAVAQGQYEFPKGLFFGGARPSESQSVLRAQLGNWLGGAERVLHLDLHSGVGKWGSYALCIDLPSSHARVGELKRAFGDEVVQAFDPRGVMYEIRGALGPWLEQRVPGARYDCLLSEFGTYPGVRVLAALRFDNRVRHYAPDDPALVRAAQRRMLEAFCPSSPAWREQVIERARAVVAQALGALV